MKLAGRFGKVGRLYPHAGRWVRLLQLQVQNLIAKNAIVGDGQAVVSLTTYAKRTAYVHLAIESIARGAVRPKRLILWLDEKEVLDSLPRSIVRLQKRGLEVRSCHNYGPHKKYYPYLASLNTDELVDPLVIVDDDFLYPETWLRGLLDSYEEYPEAVSCTRAHEFQIGHAPKPYAEWPPCQTDTPSSRTFATGVGGVLYPPAAQRAIKARGTQFESSAPRADDVWLHFVTIASGINVRQTASEPLDLEFKILPFAQGESLQVENVGLAGNDIQIQTTYDEVALDVLRSASKGCRSGNLTAQGMD